MSVPILITIIITTRSNSKRLPSQCNPICMHRSHSSSITNKRLHCEAP